MLQESSLVDETPQVLDCDLSGPTYEVVDEGSQKGKQKLVDSDGYTYTVKRKGTNGTEWTCSVRNKNVHCRATVRQSGDTFVRGPQPHIHDSVLGADIATKLKVAVKQTAAAEVFTSAAEIVNRVVRENGLIGNKKPCPALPKPHYLARQANRHRQQLRHAEPHDLDFDLNEDVLPSNFFRGSVWVGEKRHILFATDNMLNLLAKAKVWYMDATFKLVKEPFKQLFSIHAFVRQGEDSLQVPLLFCLMSAKRKLTIGKCFKRSKTFSSSIQTTRRSHRKLLWTLRLQCGKRSHMCFLT